MTPIDSKKLYVNILQKNKVVTEAPNESIVQNDINIALLNVL